MKKMSKKTEATVKKSLEIATHSIGMALDQRVKYESEVTRLKIIIAYLESKLGIQKPEPKRSESIPGFKMETKVG